METGVFIFATAICAVGWLKKHISCMAIIYYMKTKGYKLPSNKEIEECTREAVNHLFK